MLASAKGARHKRVAAESGHDTQAMPKWRNRFLERSLEGLRTSPVPGRPAIDDERIEAAIVRTLESAPPDATH